MKVLIAGNSQASSLLLALNENLFPSDAELAFAFNVIPGGTGPNFEFENDRLTVLNHTGPYAPFAFPADATERPISGFDAIVVSALGYVDGGFAYPSTNLISDAALAEFGPKRQLGQTPMISQACFQDVLAAELERHSGVQFLRRLRRHFVGKILVQPFPYLSDVMIDRDDWHIRRRYEDALGFHRYLSEARDRFLVELCESVSAEMLPHPELLARSPLFTPAQMMSERDGLHPKPAYGALVLEGIRQALR